MQMQTGHAATAHRPVATPRPSISTTEIKARLEAMYAAEPAAPADDAERRAS
ncbi:hypothetical protein [Rhodococcus sp. HNM0569]|uniref:hypothetical protein n=1 Tax=Rhodococcus sp. HNM0569 TaxID=2716340 RepID=UPI00146A16F5|nr:hypothetical protein [Rhodococcus sp. HNM0569]NLU82709.1 hypothetical protein [Rhodococcus sp. HNM0569]